MTGHTNTTQARLRAVPRGRKKISGDGACQVSGGLATPESGQSSFASLWSECVSSCRDDASTEWDKKHLKSIVADIAGGRRRVRKCRFGVAASIGIEKKETSSCLPI